MNENVKKIREYLLSKGLDEEYIDDCMGSSVYLAMEIMEYAHRNQKRENGEDYANHPGRCLITYRNLIGIGADGLGCIDRDLLDENRIPFDGVQEVCLLHDVIEDTEFSFEDVRNIYIDCGFKLYFDANIGDPLKRITHDKKVPYAEYVWICMMNPVSALVKLIDMNDNLRILDLVEFGKKQLERAQKYLGCSCGINDYYHFIEHMAKYRQEYQAMYGNENDSQIGEQNDEDVPTK